METLIVRATLNVRASVLLAVTNPFVLLLAVLLLLVATCVPVVLLDRVLFGYARNELASPRSS